MGEDLQMLFGAALVWTGVFFSASLAAAVLYSVFRKLTGFAPPAPRGVVLALYGMLPVLVASLVVCLLNFSVLYTWLVPEHCHDAACTPHAPEFAAPAAQASVTAAAALIALSVVGWFIWQQLRRRFNNSRIARRFARPRTDYQVIDSAVAAAWCDGLWSPTVFVSSELLDTLEPAELQLVINHEKAHARRRDNLVKLTLDWTTRLWLPASRKALLNDYSVAAEQACDAEAARGAESGQLQQLITRLATANAGHAQLPNERLRELEASGHYSDGSMLAPWFALILLWLGAAFVFSLAAHPLLEMLSV